MTVSHGTLVFRAPRLRTTASVGKILSEPREDLVRDENAESENTRSGKNDPGKTEFQGD